MKKIWVYLLGVLSGVVLMFIIGFIINMTKSSNIRVFDKPGDIITIQKLTGEAEAVQSFEVFQVLDNGTALATGGSLFQDINVLLWNNKGTPYYDNQIVTAPQGKCFRQVGIFKYESTDKMIRTVPIVTIMDGRIE